MANTLKIKRGTAATIPQGQLAEPLFTTDTYDLYIGKGSGGNQRIQNYIASGTSSQFLKGDGTLDSTSYQPLITAGTTSQYYRGDKTFQTLDTSVVPENGPIYFTEPRVRATVLTGLNLSGGGTIAATDSILTAFGKVQNQISALVGGATYQGTWNANTNTPTLASGTGTKGYYYVVSVAGSTNLDGITDWKIGDWAIFNGTTWDKVDNTDAVSSVNGFTGAVNLALDNISDVSAASPTNAQLLRYNGTSSAWENWTPNYITGNQTITLSGDVSGSGTTTIATTIGAGKVTNAMLAGSIAASKLVGTDIATVGTITTGIWNGTTIAIADGGTGATTKAAAFNALSPMTTLGDIIYGGASGAGTRLAGNTAASKRFLIQTGDGTNSAAPSWGSIAAGDVPTLNQNTTGSAATLTTARTLTIGATGKTFDGSANVSWTLAEIGAAAALSGTSGRVAYWNSGTTIAADDSLLFSPTSTLAVNNVITAAAGGASAFNLISTINAAANNDILYGVRISPTFNNGAFTGVTQRALGVFGNVYINGTITSGAWNGSVIGSSYGGAGTVNGIMKANGSGTVSAAVAGTDYVIPSALNSYLPLAGGTLTGALSGTSATFTNLTQDAIQTVLRIGGNNASGQLKALDFKLTAGTPVFTISTAAVGTDAGINIMPNGSSGLSIAFTGAATFSSSVTAGGSVGVGGTNTDSLLTVNGTAGTSHERFREGSTTVGFVGGANGIITGHNGKLALRAESGLILSGTGNSPDVIIASGGNVGIGTTSPAAIISGTETTLNVKGNVASAVGSIVARSFGTTNATSIGIAAFDTSNVTAVFTESNSPMAFYTNSTEKMRITSGGNVGIGTTSIPNNLGNALQLGGATNFMSFVSNSYFLNNWYYDSSGNAKYIASNAASGYIQDSSGNHKWFSNPSGTANATFTPSERMIITSGGNVLIGSTSFIGARLESKTAGNGTGFSNSFLGYDSSASGNAFVISHKDGESRLMSSYVGSTAVNSDITFWTTTSSAAQAERMRITSGGNVGIGTTSPVSTLHLWGAKPNIISTENGVLNVDDNTAFATGVGGSIALGGKYRTLGDRVTGAAIAASKVNSTDGDYGFDMLFYSRQNGATLAERMRITSGGKVGIGNTNPASYNADANNLVVGTGSANGGITITTGIYDNGSIYFAEGTSGTSAYKGYIQYQQALDDLVFGTSGIARFTISGAGFYYLTNILASSTANAANVYVSTTTGLLAYSTSSRKYKHDIRPYDRGINDLMKMNPVYYKGINDGDTQFAGLIAEEIDQLGMKEYVDYFNNEPNALRYSNMVTILVKAIQELKTELDTLKNR